MRTSSFYPLLNPFQILRDVFFREAQRSTCAITGQPLTPNLTHHCRAGDATTKLPDILNGVLRSPALQRRASLHLLRYLLFHSSLACEYHESLSTPAYLDLVSDFSEGKAAYSNLPSGQSLFFGSYDARVACCGVSRSSCSFFAFSPAS
jgi:hypothetical protein